MILKLLDHCLQYDTVVPPPAAPYIWALVAEVAFNLHRIILAINTALRVWIIKDIIIVWCRKETVGNGVGYSGIEGR